MYQIMLFINKNHEIQYIHKLQGIFNFCEMMSDYSFVLNK